MLDASVVVDALVGDHVIGALAREALDRQASLQAPSILPAEVASALRGLTLRGELAAPRAATALDQLSSARLEVYAFLPFARRVWALRDHVTVYDGWYVALAERLQLPLITLDARLAAAPGVRCPVVVLTSAEER